MRVSLVAAIFVAALTVGGADNRSVTAAEPGWSPIVIPTGEYRARIKAMPIEQRPYRPLHVYGNTVRRSYYRGNPMVTPRDILTTTNQLISRR
ncbi:MAG: hypothetical protein ACO1RT_08720 [Planctomycetaceae bacterium]